MKPRASFLLFSPGGVPMYAHATLPLGLAVASQFSFRPGAWLGLIVIILVHEAGHALLLRHFRLPVLHIVLHGFGGECRTVSWISPWQRSVVAWGGIVAQLALLLTATGGANLGLWPRAFLTSDFFNAVTATNFLIAVLNLLPFGPLDGRQAWRILWFVFLRAKRAWLGWRLERMRASSGRRNAKRRKKANW